MKVISAHVSGSHHHKRGRGLLGVSAAALAAALVLMTVTPAQAVVGPRLRAEGTGPNTEIVISSTGNGLNVTGYLPPTVIVQDPQASYPATPPAEYVAEEAFAGVINTQSVDDPSLTAEMYCINLRVNTYVGIGYESGTWGESAVPNVGYVTYILNNNYPAVDAPTGLTADQQAAAVQAAIWFFTDGFVLGSEPAAVRTAAAAIIAAAQSNGPVPEPAAPDVAITPPTAAAETGTAAGPYVVTAGGGASITVSVPDGYTMYSDAAATTPLANPSTVASGTSIWLTGPGVTGVVDSVLNARAVVTVQTGNVYLYDGNTPSLSDAQRLILAVTTELEAVASAGVEFYATGALTVNKAFAGGAVGEQGASQLAIDCGGGFTFTADIAAGAADTQTFTYSGIPVGSSCTVTEPTTGASTAVLVATDAPQTAEVVEEGVAVTVTNTVEFAPGSINLIKSITGGAAGSQDEISVSITCVSGLEDTFVIPAGSAAGDYTQTYTDLPAGDECTVAEQESGGNTVVSVTTDAPVTVTIAPGAAVDARVTNAVEFLPGSLNLTKLISGDGAGSQSDVSLGVVCDSGLEDTFVIPAGSVAGQYAKTVESIPAGALCTVTELESGANTVVAVVPGDPVVVTIEPGAAATASFTNTVTLRPGALNVIKAINGTGAGLQSAISLAIVCDNGLTGTFDIPANAAAGQYSQTFSDLPAGTECTVSELQSGANSAVSVMADKSVTVTIAPGAQTEARLTNMVVGLAFIGPALASTGVSFPVMPVLGAGFGMLLIGLLVMMIIRFARRHTASDE